MRSAPRKPRSPDVLAVKAKNEHKLLDALGKFTNGCNACHQSMDRKFIVIGLPTGQPFTNQVFAPQGKK